MSGKSIFVLFGDFLLSRLPALGISLDMKLNWQWKMTEPVIACFYPSIEPEGNFLLWDQCLVNLLVLFAGNDLTWWAIDPVTQEAFATTDEKKKSEMVSL